MLLCKMFHRSSIYGGVGTIITNYEGVCQEISYLNAYLTSNYETISRLKYVLDGFHRMGKEYIDANMLITLLSAPHKIGISNTVNTLCFLGEYADNTGIMYRNNIATVESITRYREIIMNLMMLCSFVVMRRAQTEGRYLDRNLERWLLMSSTLRRVMITKSPNKLNYQYITYLVQNSIKAYEEKDTKRGLPEYGEHITYNCKRECGHMKSLTDKDLIDKLKTCVITKTTENRIVISYASAITIGTRFKNETIGHATMYDMLKLQYITNDEIYHLTYTQLKDEIPKILGNTEEVYVADICYDMFEMDDINNITLILTLFYDAGYVLCYRYGDYLSEDYEMGVDDICNLKPNPTYNFPKVYESLLKLNMIRYFELEHIFHSFSDPIIKTHVIPRIVKRCSECYAAYYYISKSKDYITGIPDNKFSFKASDNIYDPSKDKFHKERSYMFRANTTGDILGLIKDMPTDFHDIPDELKKLNDYVQKYTTDKDTSILMNSDLKTEIKGVLQPQDIKDIIKKYNNIISNSANIGFTRKLYKTIREGYSDLINYKGYIPKELEDDYNKLIGMMSIWMDFFNDPQRLQQDFIIIKDASNLSVRDVQERAKDIRILRNKIISYRKYVPFQLTHAYNKALISIDNVLIDAYGINETSAKSIPNKAKALVEELKDVNEPSEEQGDKADEMITILELAKGYGVECVDEMNKLEEIKRKSPHSSYNPTFLDSAEMLSIEEANNILTNNPSVQTLKEIASKVPASLFKEYDRVLKNVSEKEAEKEAAVLKHNESMSSESPSSESPSSQSIPTESIPTDSSLPDSYYTYYNAYYNPLNEPLTSVDTTNEEPTIDTSLNPYYSYYNPLNEPLTDQPSS